MTANCAPINLYLNFHLKFYFFKFFIASLYDFIRNFNFMFDLYDFLIDYIFYLNIMQGQ